MPLPLLAILGTAVLGGTLATEARNKRDEREKEAKKEEQLRKAYEQVYANMAAKGMVNELALSREEGEKMGLPMAAYGLEAMGTQMKQNPEAIASQVTQLMNAFQGQVGTSVATGATGTPQPPPVLTGAPAMTPGQPAPSPSPSAVAVGGVPRLPDVTATADIAANDTLGPRPSLAAESAAAAQDMPTQAPQPQPASVPATTRSPLLQPKVSLHVGAKGEITPTITLPTGEERAKAASTEAFIGAYKQLGGASQEGQGVSVPVTADGASPDERQRLRTAAWAAAEQTGYLDPALTKFMDMSSDESETKVFNLTMKSFVPKMTSTIQEVLSKGGQMAPGSLPEIFDQSMPYPLRAEHRNFAIQQIAGTLYEQSVQAYKAKGWSDDRANYQAAQDAARATGGSNLPQPVVQVLNKGMNLSPEITQWLNDNNRAATPENIELAKTGAFMKNALSRMSPEAGARTVKAAGGDANKVGVESILSAADQQARTETERAVSRKGKEIEKEQQLRTLAAPEIEKLTTEKNLVLQGKRTLDTFKELRRKGTPIPTGFLQAGLYDFRAQLDSMVENESFAAGKANKPSPYETESGASTLVKQIEDKLNVKLTPDQIKFFSNLAILRATHFRQFAGTAQTPQEIKNINPAIPNFTDAPNLLDTKLPQYYEIERNNLAEKLRSFKSSKYNVPFEEESLPKNDTSKFKTSVDAQGRTVYELP